MWRQHTALANKLAFDHPGRRQQPQYLAQITRRAAAEWTRCGTQPTSVFPPPPSSRPGWRRQHPLARLGAAPPARRLGMPSRCAEQPIAVRSHVRKCGGSIKNSSASSPSSTPSSWQATAAAKCSAATCPPTPLGARPNPPAAAAARAVWFRLPLPPPPPLLPYWWCHCPPAHRRAFACASHSTLNMLPRYQRSSRALCPTSPPQSELTSFRTSRRVRRLCAQPSALPQVKPTLHLTLDAGRQAHCCCAAGRATAPGARQRSRTAAEARRAARRAAPGSAPARRAAQPRRRRMHRVRPGCAWYLRRCPCAPAVHAFSLITKLVSARVVDL